MYAISYGSANQRTTEKTAHLLSPGATGPVTRGSKKVSQLGTHCYKPGKWEGTVGNTGVVAEDHRSKTSLRLQGGGQSLPRCSPTEGLDGLEDPHLAPCLLISPSWL